MDAVNPFAAQLAVMHAAHEGGVLARHRLLIAIAVERPGLHLAFVQLAAMQHLMERMLVVIALLADGADRGLERLLRQGRRVVPLGRRELVHSVTSMPSAPISHPAAFTIARSFDEASSVGLELLMCT